MGHLCWPNIGRSIPTQLHYTVSKPTHRPQMVLCGTWWLDCQELCAVCGLQWCLPQRDIHKQRETWTREDLGKWEIWTPTLETVHRPSLWMSCQFSELWKIVLICEELCALYHSYQDPVWKLSCRHLENKHCVVATEWERVSYKCPERPYVSQTKKFCEWCSQTKYTVYSWGPSGRVSLRLESGQCRLCCCRCCMVWEVDHMRDFCPFISQHPDLFVLFVVVLSLAYLIYYVIFCLLLHILAFLHQCSKHTAGTSWIHLDTHLLSKITFIQCYVLYMKGNIPRSFKMNICSRFSHRCVKPPLNHSFGLKPGQMGEIAAVCYWWYWHFLPWLLLRW